MNCLEKSYCSKKKGILKFLTCSIAFIFAFFLGGVFASHSVAEAAIDVEIHDSNYKGNNTKGSSYGAIRNEASGSLRYFVQGSSIAKKDVVTFTITNFFAGQGTIYDAFAVSEEGYTGSAGTAMDYDTYVYDVTGRDAWTSDDTTNKAGSGESGLVMGDGCATNFNALSNQLKANDSSMTYVSLFCKDGNDLKYAYTLRTPGYGLKTIHIFYYKLATGIAKPAEDYNVDIVVSKPISEFNDSVNDGFTWIQKNSNNCPTDHKKMASDDITATNEICVNYDNSGNYNEERKLNIEIPKEVAYTHAPTTDVSAEDNIKNSTIYAINTFQNNGSSKFVKYYYHNFYFEAAPTGSDASLYNNTTIDENYSYKLEIMIDARGNYVFYIKDLFENTFTSIPESTSNTDIVSSNNDDIVRITNISIRNLLIDYINSDKLTILKAVTELVNNSGFGGEIAELHYDELIEIMYANLQKDQATIILETFSKVLIKNGKSFCDYSTVHCTPSDDLEEIKKETLQNTEIAETWYWKVQWKNSYSVADAAKPNDGTIVSRENSLYIQGNSYLNREYNVSGHKNRLEVVVTDNARYRFYVEDVYGNNTGKDIDETTNSDNFLINPYVDVTVIDRTTPVLTSGITGADNTNKKASTTIYSYDYVIGGGRNQVPEIDLIANPNESSIYYNSKGNKYFDYEDAIRIAQINAADQTSIESYLIRFVSGSIENSKNANAVKSTGDDDGKYFDPSSTLKSDRNTSNTTTVIGTLNLHDYILSNNISSFTGGLVIPVTSAEIVNNKFTLNGTEYTINYTNDKPMNLNGTITINDGRTFTVDGSSYIISGNRIITYVENSLAKTQVFETNYTILEADTYLNYSTNDGAQKTFVNGLDSAYAYTGAYVGFIKITFKEVGTDTIICSVGENSDVNMACFKEINKYIDTVRSFDMVFDVEDYVGHMAAAYTVTVNVEDNTAPGFLPEFRPQGKDKDNNDIWTNVYDDSACMLEIGNKLQFKGRLIDCYLLGANVEANNDTGTYHFVDNDTTYTNDPEKQWYEETGKTNYFNSIKLEIELDDGTYEEVTNISNIQLNKARDHNFIVTISDNWMNNKTGGSNNTLTIKMTYYVNPRTLLIEPIANEKVYGQADPTFDYCVYINKDINTFSRANQFFDKDFLETYFKLAYCTGGVNDRSSEYGDSNIHEIKNILLNGNAFAGKLSRVENDWYNKYNNGIDNIQNNYVGYYDIILGDLAINKTEADANAACKNNTDYTCDQDYVVKIHPKFLIDDVTSYDTYGTGQIVGTRQVTQAKTVDSNYTEFVTGKEQKQNKDPELNDEPLTESKVKFTVKQSTLNVTANGGTKLFGEQDSNSHNWNNEGTFANSINSTGYLNGYTIEGLQGNNALYYYDTNATTESPSVISPTNIILGTLRREIGENVGRYMICNIKNTNPSSAFADPNICGASTNHGHAGQYSTVSGQTFMFDAYDLYGVGGISDTAALVINTNGNIYGTSVTTVGHSLNNENRNYVINFEEAYYYIQANDMIIQPGVNQGKEYAKTPYLDPIWQLVVYGETVTCNGVTSCTSNVLKNDTGFTGYTADIETYSYSELSIANYQGSNVPSSMSPDTAIYYNRRKASPDVTYKYELKYSLTTSDGKYTNVYSKSGDYYYLDINLASSNTSWSDKYVYAYGTYHPITSVSEEKVTITIIGHLVNQTYTLFGSGTNGESEYEAGKATLSREGNNEVGWYKFNAIDNTSTSFRLNINGRSECATAIGTSGTIDATSNGENKCRNYNLIFEDSAPDSYKDTTGNDISLGNEANFDMSTIGEIITIQNTNNEYRPNGKNGCFSHSDNYTSKCNDADKTKVLFEIFKREIVVSFDANRYTFIYGNRYDYYDGGSSYVNNSVAYNSKNGIFHIYDGDSNGQSSSEGDIFVCYDENKVAARCTNDPRNTTTYDYGVTRGDTWTSVGLEFYMHPAISKSDTKFYANTSDSFAIPAGTYFVYADINESAKANYKFTYLGGTLTINPKVTSIQLTSYTMEYGETYYYSYGLGTNYSDYISYLDRCMGDAEYTGNLSNSEALITGCGSELNELGNTYGFTIEGLDYNDTIANSFKGRPSRESGTVVGYYKIGVNNIGTITNTRGLLNPTGSSDTCTSMANNNNLAACSIYKTLDSQNYDIEYSRNNNEGAYLFITPANINIEVEQNQTKMYGCAYSYYNTSSNYPYTIANGYSNCDEENKNPSDDIAYKYTVTGDKNYTSGSSYTVSKVKGATDGSEFPSGSSLQGSLYRVDYTTDYINYINMYNNSKNDIYQGQSVGTYIITLGDLNAKTNDTNKCDVFNNPAVDGTLPCRNFNLNYYGNSAANHYVDNDVTKDATTLASGLENHENHVEHKYSTAGQILVSKLKTYNLNYVESATGNYYYINGKFVSSSEINTLTNYYVSVDSLTKYKLKDGYIYNGHLYKESATGTYYRDKNEFKLAADANIADTTLRYEQFSAITTEADKYEELASGQANLSSKVYVNINGKFVSLDSLNKYKLEESIYTRDDNAGTYVLVYSQTATSGLTRYALDINNMYVAAEGTTGAYVFINGSYVLKSTALEIISGSFSSTVSVNSAMVLAGQTVDSGIIVNGRFYGGSVDSTKHSSTSITDVAVANATLFTITRRDVHVHTEYNVKYVGNDDLTEIITCEQIFASYGLGSDYSVRSYCDDATTEVELGKARYYAVDNSLAKYPWTEWVDKNNGAQITGDASQRIYNDIQFDVLTGMLQRKMATTDGKEDPVGKYVYNFANIKVTNNSLSGQNYKIYIETSTTWDKTYIKDNTGTATLNGEKYKLLSNYAERYSDSACSIRDDVNGYYISINGGTCANISFVNKNRTTDGNAVGSSIDFWYLGFYAIDGSEGREGQQKKWWTGTKDKVNKKSNNTNLFKIHYDKLKLGKNSDDTDLTASNGFIKIEDWDLSEGKEVYFEIVRKTIYLYAVDESKVYGTADKYENFRVAVCATNLGYTVDANGNVSCVETDSDYDSETNGLTAEHQSLFYRIDGNKKYMKQAEIKGASGYAFIGTSDTSMKIYFKRTAGENAGVYSITACSTQEGIDDCSDPAQEEQAGGNRVSIGDDYRIVEIAGTLTIETRKITIVPDENQGFMYGNYTNNGSIPSITYKEYFGYGEDGTNKSQGLVNSGNSDTDSNVATCLINVSGESVVCINDNQNNDVAVSDYVYLHQSEYGASSTKKGSYTASTIAGWSNTCTDSNGENCRYMNINNVYKDYYSDPDETNFNNRVESSGGTNPSLSPDNGYRYALNRICGSTTDLRYGRDVCNYEIVAGELQENSVWEQKAINEYVRMVFTNLYTKESDGTWKLYEGVTMTVDGVQKDNVKDFSNLNYTNLYLKVGNRYYPVTAENRYGYAYEVATLAHKASYVKSSDNYYKITEEYRYSDSTCSTPSVTGNYLKTGAGCIEIVDGTNTYKLSKNKAQKNNGEFLKITSSNSDNSSYAYNYTIEKFVEGRVYTVGEATLEVTPLVDQYKIYGEADPEIKFNVTTTYTVKSDHLVPFSNIKTIDGQTFEVGNFQRYDANYTANASGLYVKVLAGQIVVLKGYAYMENMEEVETGASTLNYGKNYAAIKHDKAESTVANSTAGAIHYDAYTRYNDNITVSRILIGNLYVEGHNQNVGVRRILNGFVVANNTLGNKNYLLPIGNVNGGATETGATNDVEGTVKFTIIPRPMYIEINNVTKMYGTSTDILSCDEGVTDCTPNGLSNNQQYLAYNYVINETKDGRSDLTATALGSVANVYNPGDLMGINLPTVKSSARENYGDITSFTTDRFYVGSNVEGGERQGGTTIVGTTQDRNDLQIIVERGNYNTSRNTATCYVNGEGYLMLTGKGCEDVGIYYLNFKGTHQKSSSFADGSYEKSVETYYHNDYWGYNPNYYMIIENTIDTSIDVDLNKTTSDANSYNILQDTQKKGATLEITKKPIEIVIETFSARGGTSTTEVNRVSTAVGNRYSGTLGEVYNIEQGTDVPNIPMISNSATHTTYQNITWYMHPNQVRTKDNIFGHAAYYQTPIAEVSGQTIEETVQKYVLSTSDYTKLVYHNNGVAANGSNNANSGPNVFDTSVAGYYAITRNINELYIRYDNGKGGSMTYDGDNSQYESNNYTTTFVNGILKIDNDKTAPVIFAGSEYYTIEANNGTLTNMDDLSEDTILAYLNALKNNKCKAYTGIQDENGSFNFGDCDSTLFATAIKITGGKFKLNNYEWTISGSSIQRDGGNVSIPITNGQFTMADLSGTNRTYTIAKNGENPVLVLLKGTSTDASAIEISTAEKLMQWFNIRSHDPSIMRAGVEQAKRYNARYYFAIDEKFNQRVTGDYTIYIYAADNAGNISRATTVTLRIQDTTTPEVGNLNLYSGKVTCDYNSNDCQKEENWKVAETIWIPTNAVNEYNLTFITDTGLYNYGGNTVSPQGEFYRIVAGTDARAIKHLNWSNSKDGIYMTITENSKYNDENNTNYSKDNTINYLNLDGYVKLTRNGDNYSIGITSTSGKYGANSYILLGSVVNINNITHYYKQDIYFFPTDPTKETKTDETGYPAGTIIYVRINGSYVELSSLVRYSFDANTYTKAVNGDYIFVGELKDVSGLQRYNSNLIWDASGSYIKLDQWDHYFSRDNGASWIKYDRETTTGYIALGEDGKRLITIKAVDTGVEFTLADSTNTVNGTPKNYFDSSYYYDLPAHEEGKRGTWNDPGSHVVSEDFKEYSVRSDHYNVSDWAADAGVDGYYRDRKYAYLDTQQPILELDGHLVKVYEYGCTNCTAGYDENYGKVIDSYFTPIANFKRYSDEAGTTRSDTGAYILVYKKNANRLDTPIAVEILNSKRLYKESSTKTTAATCIGASDKWVNGKCYEQNNSGTHVYLGIQLDNEDNLTVDTLITGKISTKIGSDTTLAVLENNGTANKESTNATLDNSNSDVEKIIRNTAYELSGVSGENIMAGNSNSEQEFDASDYKHKNVVIYLAESSPIAGLKSILTGDIFGTLKNSVAAYDTTYYYKYVISATADDAWTIQGWYSTDGGEDSYFTTLIPGLNLGTFTTLQAAINKIVVNNLTGKNYAGKNLTFSINYTSTDMAGNVSKSSVRGAILSDFLSTVVFTRGEYDETTSQYLSSYTLDVGQNTNALSVMGKFNVTTTKSSSYDKYIIQTVYYNDKLIASEQKYDENYLSKLDTSVPGVYKIIYNTKVMDNGSAVYSKPFELIVNVKPTVASINNKNINYKQVIMVTGLLISIIATCTYTFLISKKRKHN